MLALAPDTNVQMGTTCSDSVICLHHASVIVGTDLGIAQKYRVVVLVVLRFIHALGNLISYVPEDHVQVWKTRWYNKFATRSTKGQGEPGQHGSTINSTRTANKSDMR